MHHKAIKTEIRKQLKTRYPHWPSLAQREKKAIAKKVLRTLGVAPSQPSKSLG